MSRLILILIALLAAACSLSTAPQAETIPTDEAPPFTIMPRATATLRDHVALTTDRPTALPVAQAGTALPTVVPTIALTSVPPTIAALPASGSYTPVDPAVRAIALSSAGGLGEVALAGGARAVSFNPIDPKRYARVDEFGGLRFVPENGQEGVYTFAPYFEGFTAGSLEANPLRLTEVQWSPNGQQLAFIISSGDAAANDGLWFWQPAREIGTDPSYHLLRDCPPGCNLVERRNVQEWKTLSLEWAADNQAILVSLFLPQQSRRALAVRQAVRDPETTQSRVGPDALLYDYGHWTPDGQRIVVSGKGPNGAVVFGTIGRDGASTLLTPALDIGLGWAQDAVIQPASGQIIMLGAEGGAGGALRLYDSSGQALSDFIGNGPPSRVSWSPDRTAVLVSVDQGGGQVRHYIAQTDGTITDITADVGQSPIAWVAGSLPPTAQTRTPALPSGVVAGSKYQPGQQLRVYADKLDIHTAPSQSASRIGTITMGEYVAILAGPVEAENIIWWRVQTVTYTGWLAGQIGVNVTLGP